MSRHDTRPTPSPPAGRGWAYAGVVLGGVVSVAANVAHSWVPPPGSPTGWSPRPGAVVGAVVWPVFLFVAVEILARHQWPAGHRWLVVRCAGMLPVALVAAVVSYRHLAGLLAFYGEDALTVAIGPLAVDGLMVMATGALIAASTTRATPTTVRVPPPAVWPASALEACPDAGHRLSGVDVPGLTTPGSSDLTTPRPRLSGLDGQAVSTLDRQPESTRDAVRMSTSERRPHPASLPPMPAELLAAAHAAAARHLATTGHHVTRDVLRDALRVSTATAGELLRAVGRPGPDRANGVAVHVDQTTTTRTS